MSVTQSSEEFQKSLAREAAEAADKLVLGEVKSALEKVISLKPGDRSERDRRYAIIATDLEKVLAYCQQFLGGANG